MAGEDPQYTQWLGRRRWCVACGERRPNSIHHKTGAGMALRSHDHDGMPLCGHGTVGCHGSIHSLRFGYFKDWPKQRLRDWQQEMVGRLRSEYLSLKMESAPIGVEEEVF